jgi:hypothetical protein
MTRVTLTDQMSPEGWIGYRAKRCTGSTEI